MPDVHLPEKQQKELLEKFEEAKEKTSKYVFILQKRIFKSSFSSILRP